MNANRSLTLVWTILVGTLLIQEAECASWLLNKNPGEAFIAPQAWEPIDIQVDGQRIKRTISGGEVGVWVQSGWETATLTIAQRKEKFAYLQLPDDVYLHPLENLVPLALKLLTPPREGQQFNFASWAHKPKILFQNHDYRIEYHGSKIEIYPQFYTSQNLFTSGNAVDFKGMQKPRFTPELVQIKDSEERKTIQALYRMVNENIYTLLTTPYTIPSLEDITKGHVAGKILSNLILCPETLPDVSYAPMAPEVEKEHFKRLAEEHEQWRRDRQTFIAKILRNRNVSYSKSEIKMYQSVGLIFQTTELVKTSENENLPQDVDGFSRQSIYCGGSITSECSAYHDVFVYPYKILSQDGYESVVTECKCYSQASICQTYQEYLKDYCDTLVLSKAAKEQVETLTAGVENLARTMKDLETR